MEKWGLGYEDVLKKKFPKLIHCRISGFGATGPLGGAPGYDAIVQAMTGMMSINGHAGGGDVRVGAPVVDMGTGLYATIGILMAIQEKNKSGLGQFLDMSLYDSALALMHPHTGNYFLSSKPGKATGNAHPNIAPYDKFKTATNEIFMGIGWSLRWCSGVLKTHLIVSLHSASASATEFRCFSIHKKHYLISTRDRWITTSRHHTLAGTRMVPL